MATAAPAEDDGSIGKDDGVRVPTDELDVEGILTLLASGARRPLRPGTAVTQLDHALQTASSLEHAVSDDPALAVAGLVHDIGHLMPGVGDEEHAQAAADAVRATLGERVAGLVALHVTAKRYLVATDPGYGGVLAADSVDSLAVQGGPLSDAEASRFAALPLAEDAVRLRRADDGGKLEALAVQDLDHWAHRLRQWAERAAAARS